MSLYIVATPIGNLEDITLRALRILEEVDFILCEDTRVSKKLLSHYNIKKPLISYHQHSRSQKIDYIIRLLKNGKNLALVSDAGTPGISDPGNQLIARIKNQESGIEVAPIPGPSAVTAALSVSGFPTDKFIFLGFPPQKKKRKKFFQEVINSKYTVVFYESRYRMIKTLEELKLAYGWHDKCAITTLSVVVCGELTKKFEKIYRGTIDEVIEKMSQDIIKGEFVIVINKYS